VANATEATAHGYAAIASGAQSVAAGSNSVASGTGSAALGAGALAAHNNAVALGANSTTDRDNSVSVGDAGSGLQRQITNVAPGTLDSDAATVGQLRAQEQSGQRFAIQQAQSAGAVVAAAANAAMAASGAPGTHKLAVGAGSLGGQAGFGVAYQQSFGNLSATLTGASNGSSDYTHFGAGAAIGW
jgi:autotransporter adhesin